MWKGKRERYWCGESLVRHAAGVDFLSSSNGLC